MEGKEMEGREGRRWRGGDGGEGGEEMEGKEGRRWRGEMGRVRGGCEDMYVHATWKTQTWKHLLTQM